MQVNSLRSHNPNGGITIRERQPAAAAEPSQPASAEEKQQQADADYARQLQAKLDAQEARGGNKSDALPLVLFVVLQQAYTVWSLPLWGSISVRVMCAATLVQNL